MRATRHLVGLVFILTVLIRCKHPTGNLSESNDPAEQLTPVEWYQKIAEDLVNFEPTPPEEKLKWLYMVSEKGDRIFTNTTGKEQQLYRERLSPLLGYWQVYVRKLIPVFSGQGAKDWLKRYSLISRLDQEGVMELLKKESSVGTGVQKWRRAAAARQLPQVTYAPYRNSISGQTSHFFKVREGQIEHWIQRNPVRGSYFIISIDFTKNPPSSEFTEISFDLTPVKSQDDCFSCHKTGKPLRITPLDNATKAQLDIIAKSNNSLVERLGRYQALAGIPRMPAGAPLFGTGVVSQEDFFAWQFRNEYNESIGSKLMTEMKAAVAKNGKCYECHNGKDALILAPPFGIEAKFLVEGGMPPGAPADPIVFSHPQVPEKIFLSSVFRDYNNRLYMWLTGKADALDIDETYRLFKSGAFEE